MPGQQERNRNLYIKMMRLACDNVKAELGRMNVVMQQDLDVKVKDIDALLVLIQKILMHPATAMQDYAGPADRCLVVRQLADGSQSSPHRRTAGAIFTDSILRSRAARNAQSRLVGLFAAERFLHDAYSYDRRNPVTTGVTAVAQAKESLQKLLQPGAIVDFDFTSEGPVINSSVRHALENLAYDARFSFMDSDAVQRLALKKYDHDFIPEEKLFGSVHVPVQKGNTAGKMPAVKETEVTPSAVGLNHLYKGVFASLPVSGRRRRLVNLKACNGDIFVVPRSALHTKRQFAKIEMMSKHSFILDYYNDQMPDGLDGAGMANYLFMQEDAMYRKIWGHQKSVHCTKGKLVFPDGTSLPVPNGMTPHEFLHKVNTVYAALFGFTREDAAGGSEWLYDSVRKAYTDEGQAGYRLELIASVLGKKAVTGGVAV